MWHTPAREAGALRAITGSFVVPLGLEPRALPYFGRDKPNCRLATMNPADPPSSRPLYRWPRLLLVGVILFFGVSVIWVYREAARIKRQRIYRTPPTNAWQAPAPPGSTKTE